MFQEVGAIQALAGLSYGCLSLAFVQHLTKLQFLNSRPVRLVPSWRCPRFAYLRELLVGKFYRFFLDIQIPNRTTNPDDCIRHALYICKRDATCLYGHICCACREWSEEITERGQERQNIARMSFVTDSTNVEDLYVGSGASTYSFLDNESSTANSILLKLVWEVQYIDCETNLPIHH